MHRRTGKILLGELNIICPNETCWSQMHKIILSWRQVFIAIPWEHGRDHFDAWSLPSRIRFFSGMGPHSRSFQRLTSHLIAFRYPRHRNLIQFGWIVHRIIIASLLFYNTVFVAYPRSMKVKEVKCEGLQATVVQLLFGLRADIWFQSMLDKIS